MARIFVVEDFGGALGTMSMQVGQLTNHGLISSIDGDVVFCGATGLYSWDLTIHVDEATSHYSWPTGDQSIVLESHLYPYANIVPISGAFAKSSGPVLHSF